ncbi:MAG: hypothetical protein IJ829_06935, partial [Kiritimatiellae bacterium]|nr:hypothetical protein [Kiritimatiellia bacterium]
MKKTLKFIGIFVLCVVVLVVGMILALPLWIGPVAKGVANSVVPGITGTGFHLGEFGFNPYTGGIHVGDMQLANPTNFSEKNAVDLKALDVDFAMTSLLGGKKYVVESVDLDGIVVYCDATASNFRQIAENAAGEPKADDRPAVTKLADEAKVQPAEPAERQEAPADEAKEGGKGVQINRVTLKNVTIKYGVVPLAVPMDIVLTDIGKDAEEGAAFEDVALMIRDKV